MRALGGPSRPPPLPHLPAVASLEPRAVKTTRAIRFNFFTSLRCARWDFALEACRPRCRPSGCLFGWLIRERRHLAQAQSVPFQYQQLAKHEVEGDPSALGFRVVVTVLKAFQVQRLLMRK